MRPAEVAGWPSRSVVCGGAPTRSPPFGGCTRAPQRNRARRIADGAEAISDIAVLADQPALFGPVASDSTCWRLLDALDADRLSTIAGARAREVAWAQRAEATGAAFARSRVAGTTGLDALVIDLDARAGLSQRETAGRAHVQCTFGYHPLLAFLDSTGEFLAA